jgi:hypothetical protein
MRLTLSCKAVSLLPVLVLLAALEPLACRAQSESTELDGRCVAAYRATDYLRATAICVGAADAEFTEANEWIDNKLFYYADLTFGAGDQETAGESYIYGHIDRARGKELVDAAIATFREVLNNATDPQTLQNARQSLAEATKFEAVVLSSPSR